MGFELSDAPIHPKVILTGPGNRSHERLSELPPGVSGRGCRRPGASTLHRRFRQQPWHLSKRSTNSKRKVAIPEELRGSVLGDESARVSDLSGRRGPELHHHLWDRLVEIWAGRSVIRPRLCLVSSRGEDDRGSDARQRDPEDSWAESWIGRRAENDKAPTCTSCTPIHQKAARRSKLRSVTWPYPQITAAPGPLHMRAAPLPGKPPVKLGPP